jgi:flagellar basal body-associated protein FliL
LLLSGSDEVFEECAMSDAPAAEAPAPAPGKSKMLVIVLCSILAAGAAGGGVYFMFGNKGEEHAAAESAPAV